MNINLAWAVLLLALAAMSAGQADAKSVNEGYADPPGTARAEHGSEPLTITGTPNLSVSAQRQSSNNSFGGPAVIEIVVSDPYISHVLLDQVEPNVTVNGVQLRMAQTRDGDWYAYMAESDMVNAANSAVAFGSECSRADFEEGFFAAKNAYCNIRIESGITYSYGTYMDAVREPKNLGPLNGVTNTVDSVYGGQIGIPFSYWPVIQAFDFEAGQPVDITYYERGGPQTIRLTYSGSMDRYSGAYVDQQYQSYMPGQQIHMTIDDMLLNIDPTDEDAWTFSTHPGSSGTGLYYQLYDEYGSRPQLYCPDSELCRIDRAGLGFGDAGALAIYLEASPNMRLVDNGQQSLNDMQRLSEYPRILQPVTFVETGPNTGVFTNIDRSGVSSLVAADTVVNQTTIWEYAGRTNQISFNRVPELNPVGNRTVVAESELRFTVSATDHDGGRLQYSMIDGPAGAAINATTGEFAWVPAASDFGLHTFSIIVSDGLARSAEIITVNVTLPEGANRPPTAPDFEVLAGPGETAAIRPQIGDPDGGRAVITGAAGAAKGQINTDRLDEGVILYTPNPGARGTDRITYTVSDGQGGASAGVITVMIISNTPPTAHDFAIRAFAGLPVTVDLVESGLISDGGQGAGSLVLSVARAATQGSLSISGTRITYTAGPGASGTDMFHYRVTDMIGLNDTGVVDVTVSEPRRVYTLIADTVHSMDVPAEKTASFTVATNPAGPYSYFLTGQPAGATINTQGEFRWTPAASQAGAHDFTVTAYNSEGAFDSLHVTITVRAPANAPPAGRDLELRVNASMTVSDDITDILHDPDDDRITVTIARPPGQGTARASGAVLSYTANSDAAGTDSFEYRLTDEHGASSVWSVTVRIGPHPGPNRNPVAPDVAVTVLAGSSVTITPQIGDPDGDDVIITSVTGAGKGETVATEDSVTYTPRAGQAGNDTATYTVSDGRGGNATGTITIRIEVPNMPPVADNIQMRINAGMTVSDDIADILHDPEDDRITVTIDRRPDQGIAQVSGTVLSYTARRDATGFDTFWYRLTDEHGASSVWSVTLLIDVTAGAMINRPPDAPDIPVLIWQGALASIRPALTDPDGDNVTITNVTGATKGAVHPGALKTGRILYTPAPGQTGVDAITYTLSDDRGATANGTITIYINTLGNRIPTLDVVTSLGTNVGKTLSFTAGARDADGDDLIFDIANAPPGATISPEGHFRWTPAEWQIGRNTATIMVHDGHGGGRWQDIEIYVFFAGTANRDPVAGDIVTTAERGNGKIILPEFYDLDGDDAAIISVSDARIGTIIDAFRSEGLIIYLAGAELGREDIINYTVYDGRGGTATGTIDITVVERANIPPILEVINDRSVNALSNLNFTISARDVEESPLTFGLVGEPEGATIHSVTGLFSWTPTELQEGGHDFTVIVFDDAGGNDTQTVTITVRDRDYVNLPPTASHVIISTAQDLPNIVRPALTDPNEGDTVRISHTDEPVLGRILSAFLHSGIILYQPGPGQFGTETVAYTAQDTSGETDDATLTVFINQEGNVRPVMSQIGFRNINVGQTLAFDIIANDADGGAVSYRHVGGPDSVTISPQGGFSWTPGSADEGNHTFTIIAHDRQGGADTESVTIRVLPAGAPNRPPVAPDSTANVTRGGVIVIEPAISDPDGDQVRITGATGDAGGTIMPSEDSIEYIAGSAPGTETITYTVEDVRGATDTGTITVTIR